ncbi:hypothetical protein DY052_08495 [Apilactobacillus timberlakei]|uniref:hypothetical protein n=1 Tax=Apilactobacillus timberlakei TaxID=2008380 RepID=UPI00112662D4|nr:hypothetical protein [Apilactobacillus timberlakei]TPR13029.1 hypothetical protein DY052_08495 [Apilactobacillus timberlakei]
MNNGKSIYNNKQGKVSLVKKYNCNFFKKFCKVLGIIFLVLTALTYLTSHPNMAMVSLGIVALSAGIYALLSDFQSDFKDKQNKH